MELLKTYSDYKRQQPNYETWHKEVKTNDAKREYLASLQIINGHDVAENKQKAQILARALNLVDEYAQSKAEDVEAISQTLQIQVVGVSCWIGKLAGDWFTEKTNLGKKTTSWLASKMGRLNSAAPSVIPTLSATVLGISAFIPIVIKTIEEQVRFTRMARFEGLNKECGHVNDFAVLTDEQQKIVKNKAATIPDNEVKENTAAAFDIFGIMKTVKDLYVNKKDYLKSKAVYDDKLTKLKQFTNTQLSEEELLTAKKGQFMLNKMLETVEHDSQEPLRKIETLVNIGYSSLFIGGYLEYLLSDKLVEMSKIKNKYLKPVIQFGVPIVTYLLLNKQLSEFHNKSTKVVKYKKMQEFINNPKNTIYFSDTQLNSTPIEVKPQKDDNIFQFFKKFSKDMDEYSQYQKTEFLQRKKIMKATRGIELSTEQLKDAKTLKKSAYVAFNKHDDETQRNMEMIEALTEIMSVANDLIASAVCVSLGWAIARLKGVSQSKENIYKGIGSLVALLPIIWTQVYATSEQRNAIKIAQMQTMNELADINYFTGKDDD